MVTCKAKIDKAVELDKVHEEPIGALSKMCPHLQCYLSIVI